MNSAAQVVDVLKNCSKLTELLEMDLKTDSEVGIAIGEYGTIYNIKEGNGNQITFALPPSDRPVDEQRVIVHTHPSIDGVITDGLSVSTSDEAVGDHPAVGGMIILSQDMFDVNWDGKALYFPEEGSPEQVTFRIEADGTTNGPKRDRWVENPRFV